MSIKSAKVDEDDAWDWDERERAEFNP